MVSIALVSSYVPFWWRKWIGGIVSCYNGRLVIDKEFYRFFLVLAFYIVKFLVKS